MAEGIFPIVDRDTPVIDRIKERRQNGASKEEKPITTSESLAESLTSSEKERERIRNRLALTLRKEIAEEVGVDESMIRDAIPTELASLTTSYDVEEVLTDEAMDELGLTGDSLEALGEVAEEDDSEGSDNNTLETVDSSDNAESVESEEEDTSDEKF